MSVLQNAQAHYKSQLAGGLLSVEVPEWETTVYFKAAATFAQQAKIIELTNKGDLVEAMVETLLQRALTEDGKKMFTFADRAILLNQVDPEVIVRVVTAINTTKAEVGN